MASLNLSANGPSITQSYQKVVNAAPSTSGSQTYGQWAVYSVAAPLTSAFQNEGGKESVMKVQSTGEGELVDLVDEFSDGRVQFAFVKVKDPNTTLPKNVLIAWCGEGVPERTKGYFGSYLGAVSKLLHGYHVQITARSDRDLTPEGIVQKVADASGAKYSGGGAPSASSASKPPPPVATKPYLPTRVIGANSGFNPLGGRSRETAASSGNVDEDGWGQDAPPVTRTQLEKVSSAYQPTKVNMNELTSQKQQPSRFAAPAANDGPSDVVRGGYQPVGKVDIAALRRQAQESGNTKDDRPTTVKGAYEPVGKVDIAAIRAKAQAQPSRPLERDEPQEAPRPVSERSAAFGQSERMTELPKPKVANRFGSSNNFSGTKAPTPGGFGSKPIAAAAPVGAASKTFADEGGKTPAQIWAEKKARERGGDSGSSAGGMPSVTSPVRPQVSGGWQSSYSGKKWNSVQTTHTGKSAGSNLSAQNTGQEQQQEEDIPSVSAARDRFAAAPPPLDNSSKPNAGARGVAMPGLPSRPKFDEDEHDIPATQTANIPPPPAQPRSPSPPTPDLRPSSPIRIAQPVARSHHQEIEPAHESFSSAPVPTGALARAASAAKDVASEPKEDEDIAGRRTAQIAAAATFGGAAVAAGAVAATGTGGKRAIVQYDYEKAEDNEIELKEGEYVTEIDQVDDDWWMGTNARGESGLFPSNYVELVEDDEGGAVGGAAAPSHHAAEEAPPAGPAGGASSGPTATAQYDYEAAEDNELSFPEGATITHLEFPDEDWWHGSYGGKTGLFPANYVTLDE